MALRLKTTAIERPPHITGDNYQPGSISGNSAISFTVILTKSYQTYNDDERMKSVT